MKKRIGFLVAVVACLVFAFAALSACGDTTTPPPEEPAPPATLSQTSATIKKSESVELTVKLNDPATEISWSIGDSSVAVMTTKGLKATVRGASVGTTQVTVKNKADGSVLATCDITVELPKLYINLPYGLVLKNSKSVATVKAIATDDLEGEIYWELSNDTYASVEYQGLTARVSAKKVGHGEDGDVILTVYYGDESASIPVYVGTRV